MMEYDTKCGFCYKEFGISDEIVYTYDGTVKRNKDDDVVAVKALCKSCDNYLINKINLMTVMWNSKNKGKINEKIDEKTEKEV